MQLHAGTGFADPVHDAQRCFRTLLRALAEPGRIEMMDGVSAPSLSPAAAAVALTLADRDAPVWLAPSFADAAQWLRFFAGAPVVADRAQASFAFAPAAQRPRLASLAQGEPAYPDRSATLVLQVETLDAEEGGWRLTGPGIETSRALKVGGLDASFLGEWRGNRERFPCGVDVFLVTRTEIVGLPRTVTIEEAACMSQ